MSLEGDMSERHSRVLAELAEAGMVMVRRLGLAMEQADDAQTLAQVGLAFHRVSRAVRQTLALELRLAQGPRPEPIRSTPSTQSPPPPIAPARPRAERVGWNEYERADSDEALEDLDELLDAEEVDIEAVHGAIDASIARIRQDLEADAQLIQVLPHQAPQSRPLRTDVSLAAPAGRNRRAQLMGAATFPRQPATFIPSWRSSA